MVSADENTDPKELLRISIQDSRIDVLRSLIGQLSKGSNFQEIIDSPLNENGTLLHYAITKNSLDGVRALLSAGANPCAKNSKDQTPFSLAQRDNIKAAFVQELHQATAQSNLGRVCQMIASGVNPDAVDAQETGNTALHYATSFGNEEIVKTLCESGASLNAQNATGDTPLHDAVKRKSEAIVRVLLDFGADSSIKNNKDVSSFDLAQNSGSEILQVFSLNRVAQNIRRSPSMESVEFDQASIISTDTAPLLSHDSYRNLGKIESWTDLLWPQPHYIKIDSNESFIRFPVDNRLKIYFDGSGDGEPRRIMQAIQTLVPYLSTIPLSVEYRGHQVDNSPLDGRVTCGIFMDEERNGGYSLNITEQGIELFANDYAGIRYGFATLIQILRIFRVGSNKRRALSRPNDLSHPPLVENGFHPHQNDDNDSSNDPLGIIPCLSIKDYPDMTIRAVFQDFSGCKILNVETVLQMVNRLSYCKISHFFVNFEVRTTDRYHLPYTNRDLFHMTQVCEELYVKLVPSLDTQTTCEVPLAMSIISKFLDDFPLSKMAHFGPNLASILIENRSELVNLQKRIPRIFLSIGEINENDHWLNSMPPFVTLCVEGKYPFHIDSFISPTINMVLKFPTTDVGFLCASPETTYKNALLATQLCTKGSTKGVMVCDFSTGCEIMPPSMSLMPECACMGASWNREIDIKRFCFLLPRITAEHFLLDGNLVSLLEQAATLGRVEHELTKYSSGNWKPMHNGDLHNHVHQTKSSFNISVFVEIILNPENIRLERLTPSIFKKSRIELQKSMRALNEARKQMPYNYELALVLAEIQLVTELMTLISKIGQALCRYGADKHGLTNGNGDVPQTPTSPMSSFFPHYGVSKLPQTIRTDLANSLLEIRKKFQHTWMCRNLAYTLPNALKIFDNLFKALLPPNLQEYEKIL
uniref:Beta-hexosaminidase bacterial type N-terminal domain-containing protein n=1 Tax=Acrobeloides nanus TaxID=290746 RepID=A0A914DSW0_9BILA